ncbi:hypothetical protein N657DRAFT_636812 [Parathielavia appendiculata]|uniref:Uncharacterized protein n=1 Tax=Parathielavia appendiculata TaxID=2587402 RepID=A0AAN6TU07_9PEZI|nr:hypothetical protein N657DRAFT_636812 [Parathielavia appendiculata]
MLANRDGNRIYFCVYFQQEPVGTAGNPPVFHCGLWFEKTHSRGLGEYFHVPFYGPRPVNRPDYHDADWRDGDKLIGRILLGILPAGVTAQHVHQVCQGMPVADVDENCCDWTHHAIETVQTRNWLPGLGRGTMDSQLERTGDGNFQHLSHGTLDPPQLGICIDNLN